jgi:hypothetical protein
MMGMHHIVLIIFLVVAFLNNFEKLNIDYNFRRKNKNLQLISILPKPAFKKFGFLMHF